MGTAIKHPVPDSVKPSFVIFDIRALWRSALSVRVPICQKLQMTAWPGLAQDSCTHLATDGVKGSKRTVMWFNWHTGEQVSTGMTIVFCCGQVTLYLYNCMADLTSQLEKQLMRQILWHNARSHLVTCLSLQKMGLYHHLGFSDLPADNSSQVPHYHHHHHVQALSWSVAVSTRCFQCSRSWAYFHAELRPKLSGWRSGLTFLKLLRKILGRFLIVGKS